MINLEEKNSLAFLLHKELLKTAEKFTKKCPKGNDADVILGAANCYIAGFLVNAPNKEEALKTLDQCRDVMREMINATPDSFFGGGIRNNFNIN
ncbi:MAG: hypothetical protein K2K64_10125 [Muribaculaceae bacterium]|nr:hypothetical protein [Muribaculaceae bacterium]